MTDAFEPVLALRLLRRARELGLHTPGVTYLIGLSLKDCGQLDEAAEEFESCLAAAPNFARTHWALAKLAARIAGPQPRSSSARCNRACGVECRVATSLFRPTQGTRTIWATPRQRGTRSRRKCAHGAPRGCAWPGRLGRGRAKPAHARLGHQVRCAVQRKARRSGPRCACRRPAGGALHQRGCRRPLTGRSATATTEPGDLGSAACTGHQIGIEGPRWRAGVVLRAPGGWRRYREAGPRFRH